MLTEIYNYFTYEMIYMWLNYGVLPMWVALIFVPNSKLSQIFITSIFLPLIFSVVYIYILFELVALEENFLITFNLYLGIDELINLFSNERFLLLFWIHFLAINLFLGSWVSKDSFKYNVPRILSSLCLIVIYFAGPLGLLIYWFLRIFFAKKIALYD